MNIFTIFKEIKELKERVAILESTPKKKPMGEICIDSVPDFQKQAALIAIKGVDKDGRK